MYTMFTMVYQLY